MGFVWIPPMLPRSGRPPLAAGFLHEIKHDGYRMHAIVVDGRPRLVTRGGADFTRRVGSLVEEIAQLPTGYYDGEVVHCDPSTGVCDFDVLHAAMQRRRPAGLRYMIFDLLFTGRNDIRDLPLAARKALLRNVLAGAPPSCQIVDHVDDDGAAVLRAAERLGLEGIVSKRASSAYRSGYSAAWIKSKTGLWLSRHSHRGRSWRHA